MPSVLIPTANSNAKTPKYNTHQRIYSKAANILTDAPGIDDDFQLIVGNLLKAFKAAAGKLTGQTRYTGLQVSSFTTTTINTLEGWIVTDDAIYFLEGPLALIPDVAGYWGIIEFELEDMDADSRVLDYWNTVLNTPYQDFGFTRRLFHVKLYDTFNPTASMPATTVGRTRWLEYKRAGVGGNIIAVKNVLFTAGGNFTADLGSIVWKEAKIAPDTGFPMFDLTEPDQDLDAANWVDLVGYDRDLVRLQTAGAVDQWNVGDTKFLSDRVLYQMNVNTDNLRLISLLLEDILFRGGSYTFGRCLTAAANIGDQPADDYEIMFLDSVLYVATVNGGVLPNSCKLMLNFESGFVDDSPSALTVTSFGSVLANAAAKHVGTKGGNFTGGSLEIGNDPGFDFGVGDFTVEFWVNPVSGTAPTWQPLIDRLDAQAPDPIGSSAWGIDWNTGSNETRWRGPGGVVLVTGTLTLITPSTWNHVSVVRESGVTSIYVNGILSGSGADLSNYSSSKQLTVGKGYSGYALTGYMDQIRVEKGVARHSADFAPLISGVIECYPKRIQGQPAKSRHHQWKAVYPGAPSDDPLIGAALFRRYRILKHRHLDSGHSHPFDVANGTPAQVFGFVPVSNAYQSIGNTTSNSSANLGDPVDSLTGAGVPLLGNVNEVQTIGLIPYKNGVTYSP